MKNSVCIHSHLCCHWAPLRWLWLCLLTPPITYSDIKISSFQSQLSHPSLIDASFPEPSLQPFVLLVLYVYICTKHSRCVSPLQSRLHSTYWQYFFLMHPKILLAFFAARAHCRLMVTFLSTPFLFCKSEFHAFSSQVRACGFSSLHFSFLCIFSKPIKINMA